MKLSVCLLSENFQSNSFPKEGETYQSDRNARDMRGQIIKSGSRVKIIAVQGNEDEPYNVVIRVIAPASSNPEREQVSSADSITYLFKLSEFYQIFPAQVTSI